jgi:predicted nucleic acid-binding protein
MSAKFFDTNVLVYAYDFSAGEKRNQARRLLERLWESGNGAVSI